ncbi:uncharacterized protein LAJ45_10987 [Morchella importuna]|uniref:uncharacterized protein n=1 Tax=Morchella importuna TaxID=1174673 RepID=UPI001E8E30A4|nr:uncharacterized protein LAJ45_10987 [Morchella importuna]KAH8144967.1 hypothetical protein LAJ45_10987 [Morchella importuna]
MGEVIKVGFFWERVGTEQGLTLLALSKETMRYPDSRVESEKSRNFIHPSTKSLSTAPAPGSPQPLRGP